MPGESESGRCPPGTDLQHRMVAFIRAFGLHRPDETPCGAPVAVSEAHALDVLAERGSLSQAELGRALGLTKSTVSRLVDQLERHGWALRRVGDRDARSRLVSLTDEGTKVHRSISRLRQARMARLVERLPETDRTAVLSALDALVEAAREPLDD